MEKISVSLLGVWLWAMMLMPAGVLAQVSDEDDSFLTALEECCQQNIVTPLAINRLSESKLVESGVFTQWQSDIIVNYRKESGSILSALELAALLGWDEQAAGILDNYIDFSIATQRRGSFESYACAKGKLWNNWQEEKKDAGYVGLPFSSNFRLRGSVRSALGNVWEYAALSSNSRGEKFGDFISAFVSYEAGDQFSFQGTPPKIGSSDVEQEVPGEQNAGKSAVMKGERAYDILLEANQRNGKAGSGVRLLKFVAGDFTAKFGQGLTMWSAKGWSNFASASQSNPGSYCKRGNVISGRNTASDDGLLRGVAASVSLFNKNKRVTMTSSEIQTSNGPDSSFMAMGETKGNRSGKLKIESISLHGFVSYRPRDARIKDGFYTNLLSGGQHNTGSLLAAKNTVNELAAGTRLEFSGTFAHNASPNASSAHNVTYNAENDAMHVPALNVWNFRLGVNAAAWFLDKYNAAFYGKASVPDYKKYQQYNDKYANFSIDAYITHGRWIIYSEAAVDASGSMAFLAGISTTLADWNIAAHTHFYSKSYTAQYSAALSASGGSSNQRAVALSAQRSFHYKWILSMSATTVYFPWVRYQFPYPSQWNIMNANLALKLASSNYSLQMGVKDVRPASAWMKPDGSADGKYAKTQFKASFSAVFILSSSGEGSSTMGIAASFSRKLKLSANEKLTYVELPADNSREAVNGISANVANLPAGSGESTVEEGASWQLQCKVKLPLFLSVAAGIFHCPDWDGRMYAHGYQLPYSSSGTLLYGSGWHWEGMLRLDSKEWNALRVKRSNYLSHFQIYAKISGVNYWDSGLNVSLGRKNACEASFGIKFRY